MAEKDLQRFLAKVDALNAFVALSRSNASLGEALRDCADHPSVVALAGQHGFEIGRRWGDGLPDPAQPNLLAGPCPQAGQESTERLLEAPGLLLERTHSCLYSGDWQEQSGSEWVLVLRGGAQLQFADEPAARRLVAGDWLLIAPGRRHRVVATDPAPGTLWLTVTATPPGP
jgi:cupin 2 domain-containing protein